MAAHRKLPNCPKRLSSQFVTTITLDTHRFLACTIDSDIFCYDEKTERWHHIFKDGSSFTHPTYTMCVSDDRSTGASNSGAILFIARGRTIRLFSTELWSRFRLRSPLETVILKKGHFVCAAVVVEGESGSHLYVLCRDGCFGRWLRGQEMDTFKPLGRTNRVRRGGCLIYVRTLHCILAFSDGWFMVFDMTSRSWTRPSDGWQRPVSMQFISAALSRDERKIVLKPDFEDKQLLVLTWTKREFGRNLSMHEDSENGPVRRYIWKLRQGRHVFEGEDGCGCVVGVGGGTSCLEVSGYSRKAECKDIPKDLIRLICLFYSPESAHCIADHSHQALLMHLI
jgi:hypothetical protein